MRPPREHLIWKALLVVDEAAAAACEAAMTRPSLSLRFTLTFLYACGNGERWPYDTFWTAIRKPSPTDGKMCGRSTQVHSGLLAIIRNVGIDPQQPVLDALRARRGPPATIRVRRIAGDLLLDDRRELEAAKERARKYHG